MVRAAPRVRILQVITSLAGGAGLHAVQLARYLDPERFDVWLAFGSGYPLDAAVKAERLPHVELRWPRALHPWRTVQGSFDLLRLLQRESFDIVHAHCSLAGAVARPLARLMRRAVVMFTVHAFAAHERQGALKRAVLGGVERGLDHCTDRYVVSTGHYRDEMIARRIAQRDRIEVIPLGIALPPLERSGPDARRRARAELGLDESHEVVMFSGRLETQKGLVFLLQAWAALVARRPLARLVLLGDGPLHHELVRSAASLGIADSVRFAGWRDDAAALLVAADLFCLPSLWEAFGYVLLEAMAAGVPILASRVGGIPEVLAEGEFGRLCPPGDAPALAAGIAAALNEREALAAVAEKAKAHLHAQHDVMRMVQRHADVYLRELGRT